MLKKLLKHEFRATRRFFLPAYGLFVTLLVLERLSLLSAPLTEGDGVLATVSSVTMGIITFLTVVGLFALMLAPMVFNAIRFYRNMLGDEGYLTFTLPVSVDQLILSRLFTAMTWQILTGLVVGLFGGAFVYSLDPEVFSGLYAEVSTVFGNIQQAARGWLYILIPESLLLCLASVAGQLLTMYAAMSIGQLANRHKLLASFGVYIGINTVQSWIFSTFTAILVFSVDSGWLKNLGRQISYAAETGDFGMGCGFYGITLLIFIIGYCLLSLGYYFLTRYLLTKKLNLA